MSRHIANKLAEFKAVCISPDFCIVNKAVVPFEVERDLSHELTSYAHKVHAWGVPVLTIDSVVAGVVGNMGRGVGSTVSLAAGAVEMIAGSETVFAENQMVLRDQDLCLINVKG
jgi:hypothetical protein